MPSLPRQTQGKLVDTWIYAYKGVSMMEEDHDDERESHAKLVKDQRVEVKVYLRKESKELDAPPHGTKAVLFYITCDAPRIRLEGTDVEALRAAVWGLCDAHYEVKWQKYYLVRIGTGFIYDGLGAGLDFIYKDVYKGVTPEGKELLRELDKNGRTYGYKISPWPGQFTDKDDQVMACLPATEANTRALEEFARRILALRERIVDLVRPETIQQTLANLSTNTLLPPRVA